MPSFDQRSKVTLEDLLRLKRSEQPQPDFWISFERELRQKQLSALVEKRSWWRDFPRVFTRKVYLPVGATAIVAFSLISVRYYNIPSTVQTGGVSAVSFPTSNISVEPQAQASGPVIHSLGSVALHEEADLAALEEHSMAPAVDENHGQAVQQIPTNVGLPVGESPSARSIAANLASLEQSEPELLNAVLGSRLSSPVRVQNSSAPVVELASLSAGNSKRTRLLAHYNDRHLNAESSTPEAVRERLSRRLSDNDFNDRFSRFGLKGDKVSLKF